MIVMIVMIVIVEDHTPEVTKVKFHWRMPLEVHRTFPATIRWERDNPSEHATDKLNSVGKCHSIAIITNSYYY